MPLTLSQRLKTEDLFDSLRPEGEQNPNLRFKRKRNKKLDELFKNYEKYLSLSSKFTFSALQRNKEANEYRLSMEFLDNPYTSGEIAEFTMNLERFKDSSKDWGNYIGGYFLSALCNKCPDDKIVLYLPSFKLTALGYMNQGKEIVIIGDTGNIIGQEMKSGKITIKGNCDNSLGSHLEGGEIVVEKSVGDSAGYFMSGGKLVIMKDSKRDLGSGMSGGEIHIYGNAGKDVGKIPANKSPSDKPENGIIYLHGTYDSIAFPNLCKEIYHQGRIISQNGRRIE